MTRQLQIVGLCDICGESASHMEAFTLTNLAPHEIDLCDAHWESVTLVELHVTLTNHGRPVAERPKLGRPPLNKTGVDDPRSCPECGKVSKNRNALMAHLRKYHQLSLGVIEGTQTSQACPECGKEFAPAGMGRHRKQIHGVPSIRERANTQQ